MAISPASCFRAWGSAGNESTSVGFSFPRKRRFRDFLFALEVTSTFTLPLYAVGRPARATKTSNAQVCLISTDRFKKDNVPGPPLQVAPLRKLHGDLK